MTASGNRFSVPRFYSLLTIALVSSNKNINLITHSASQRMGFE
jgi:hypothetical protein